MPISHSFRLCIKVLLIIALLSSTTTSIPHQPEPSWISRLIPRLTTVKHLMMRQGTSIIHGFTRWTTNTERALKISETVSKVLLEHWRQHKLSPNEAFEFVIASGDQFIFLESPVFLAWVTYVKETQEKPIETILLTMRPSPMKVFGPALLYGAYNNKGRALANELIDGLAERMSIYKSTEDLFKHVKDSQAYNPFDDEAFVYWIFFQCYTDDARKALEHFVLENYGWRRPEKMIEVAERFVYSGFLVARLKQIFHKITDKRFEYLNRPPVKDE